MDGARGDGRAGKVVAGEQRGRVLRVRQRDVDEDALEEDEDSCYEAELALSFFLLFCFLPEIYLGERLTNCEDDDAQGRHNPVDLRAVVAGPGEPEQADGEQQTRRQGRDEAALRLAEALCADLRLKDEA